MSGDSPDRSPLSLGAASGIGAYLLGVGLLVGVERAGLYPEAGQWDRAFGLPEFLLVHIATHLPIWQFTLQWELVAYTAVLTSLLVLSGVWVTERIRPAPADAFRVGAAVAVGYFPLTVVASGYVVTAHPAVTTTAMAAPTVLVGMVCPAIFGGIGGWATVRYRDDSGQ